MTHEMTDLRLRRIHQRLEALEAAMAQQDEPVAVSVDALAQYIRFVDGNNNLGAGILAEKIVEFLIKLGIGKEQAEPVQKPVAWVECDGELVWDNREAAIGRNLYTAPPQRKPLSLTDLQEALVLTNLIDRDAIDDPEEYDEGSTLAQIDELHRIIKE